MDDVLVPGVLRTAVSLNIYSSHIVVVFSYCRGILGPIHSARDDGF